MSESAASSSRESTPSSTVAEPDVLPAMARCLTRCPKCHRTISKKIYGAHRKRYHSRKPSRPLRLHEYQRCPRCLRKFPPEFIEDHRKTHCIAKGMPLSERLPWDNACTYCREHGHECIVARQPNHTNMRTLRCLECLSRNQPCSFERDYRTYRMEDLTEHPAMTNGLLTPSPIESPSPTFIPPPSPTLAPIHDATLISPPTLNLTLDASPSLNLSLPRSPTLTPPLSPALNFPRSPTLTPPLSPTLNFPLSPTLTPPLSPTLTPSSDWRGLFEH
ncbi:hypothetical protein E4U42_005026 [Claviceps africana]|uniref:Uncharacterized protein n=1 Tax=Claviceps africana TaxID=83212 RepID=A0A8K0J6I5_9HYPO|nr:hypothetical protein E4U42_005026 [Claviceps africana]